MEAKSMEAKPQPQAPPIEQKLFRAEAMARFSAQLKAGAGFVERLVAFWSNHFAVSVAKGQFIRATAGAFEREAIRPHVLGKFADLFSRRGIASGDDFLPQQSTLDWTPIQGWPLRRQGTQ